MIARCEWRYAGSRCRRLKGGCIPAFPSGTAMFTIEVFMRVCTPRPSCSRRHLSTTMKTPASRQLKRAFGSCGASCVGLTEAAAHYRMQWYRHGSAATSGEGRRAAAMCHGEKPERHLKLRVEILPNPKPMSQREDVFRVVYYYIAPSRMRWRCDECDFDLCPGCAVACAAPAVTC